MPTSVPGTIVPLSLSSEQQTIHVVLVSANMITMTFHSWGSVACNRVSSSQLHMCEIVTHIQYHITLFTSLQECTYVCLLLSELSCRHLVCWLCPGRAVVRDANLPGRQWCGSAGGDHQGLGHAHQGTDPGDEPELHRIQIPPNQTSPLV